MHELLTLPMIFAGGLLGSSHCIGMCGGFAMTVGGMATPWRKNLVRQLIYSAGRIAMYAALGGLLAGVGVQFSRSMPFVTWGQSILAIAAGLLLVVEGIKATGCWPGWKALLPAGKNALVLETTFDRAGRFRLGGEANQSLASCPLRGGFSSLLRSGQALPLFVAGLATGLLPCGLVYAFLAMAAQTGSVGLGAATMLSFGLGTVPLMILTGLAPGFVSLKVRTRMLRCAAWCVVLVGVMTLARGAIAFSSTDNASGRSPACPFCETDE